MRSLFSAAIVVSVGLAACGGTQSPLGDESTALAQAAEGSSQEQAEPLALVPLEHLAGQHIDGVTVGTDAAEVRALLGEPQSVDADGVVMDATGTTFEEWDYAAFGLHITMERIDEDDAWVAWVQAAAPWTGVMPCGLRLGMSASDAQLVLGEDARVMDVDAWSTLSAIIENGSVVGIVFAQMGE